MGDDFHSFKEFNNKYFNLATLRSWLTKQQAFLSLPKKKTHEHWGLCSNFQVYPHPPTLLCPPNLPSKKDNISCTIFFSFLFPFLFILPLLLLPLLYIYIYRRKKKSCKAILSSFYHYNRETHKKTRLCWPMMVLFVDCVQQPYTNKFQI